MRIALAQINVIPGDLARNFQTLLDCVEQARASQVDLIAFPELCLSGYLLSDLWLDRRFYAEVMRFNEKVREISQGIAIVFGSIVVDEGFQSRLGMENHTPIRTAVRACTTRSLRCRTESMLNVRRNRSIAQRVQPKTLLPNYRFFR